MENTKESVGPNKRARLSERNAREETSGRSFKEKSSHARPSVGPLSSRRLKTDEMLQVFKAPLFNGQGILSRLEIRNVNAVVRAQGAGSPVEH